MNTSSICKIDQLLDVLKNADKDQFEEKLYKFLESICHAVSLLPADSPQEVLFSQRNNPQQRRFIALCLLRLLCHNKNIIWDTIEFRLNTFSLFDGMRSQGTLMG